MKIELPNGRTVTLNEEETQKFLDLPDELVDEYLWELVAQGRGEEVTDPFDEPYFDLDDAEEIVCDECPELDEEAEHAAQEDFLEDED
jgi:hypothetical protein